jgi:predicted amidophosphoribosyltransferase
MRCVELLTRVRNTPTQTTLHDDRARLTNLRGAFRFASEEPMTGQRVVLVDDVMTSGATLDAAGRELLRAGAGGVTGLVVAAA